MIIWFDSDFIPRKVKIQTFGGLKMKSWSNSSTCIFKKSVFMMVFMQLVLWFDSNFIPRNSKKFEYSNSDWAIRICIENEPETQKHEVP